MISLIGMGSGCPESLTAQSLTALQSAKLILGAKRLLEHLPAGCTANRKAAYKPEELLACLAAQPDTDTAILYSGDTGFYSGAAKLLSLLRGMGYPVRVLPTREGIAACEAAGVPHRNIIAMQGPFSYALNCALIEQFSIRYLVTKDGGAVGGFTEKAQAAQDAGAQLIVVRRPAENGQTAAQILARCKEVLV